MYKHLAACIGLALFLCHATAGHAQYDPRMDLVMEELQQLRESVDVLTREIKDLRERPAPRPTPRAARQDMSGPDHAALAEVQFPADPTPDALREYLQEIIRLTEGQRSYSSNDPQVEMMMRVGPGNLDLLLDAIGHRTHGLGGHYHAREAVIRLADEQHKDLILEHLPNNRELARVIVRFGWEKDAEDILLDGIAAIPDYLPRDWIQAVANLEHPDTHSLLLNYLMHGSNKSQTYEIVSAHVSEGLDEAVEEAWHQSQQEWDRKQMAPIAAEYGLQEALDFMIGEMVDPDPDNDWAMRQWRPTIIRVTGFRGPMPELIAWYEEHRDRLEFDPESRRYFLPE